jgi:predicted heme/steroid binding protein/uncharacterized membrane protein
MEQWDESSLAKFDGQDGKPTHIAHQGRVYDVSASKLWREGLHMNRHRAGQDLTAFLSAEPHGEEVFTRYPQVGTLKEKESRALPAFLSHLLERFPILRRHPHPVAVHFPIVFFLSVFVFDILYVITGRSPFHDTSRFCLIAGLLMLPPAMMTGFYTWWLNYLAQPMTAVARKIQCSSLLLVLSTAALFWRTNVPDILDPLRTASILYLLLVLALWPLVITIGYIGGSLVFPHEK